MGTGLTISDLLAMIPDEEIPKAIDMLRGIITEYDKTNFEELRLDLAQNEC